MENNSEPDCKCRGEKAGTAYLSGGKSKQLLFDINLKKLKKLLVNSFKKYLCLVFFKNSWTLTQIPLDKEKIVLF